jgi:hypothetical protein
MNNKFDELTKGMAQSVTRRGALKKFGLGLAGMALTYLGMSAMAQPNACANYGQLCKTNGECCSGYCGSNGLCGCVTRKDCPQKQLCYLGACVTFI